MKRAILFAFAAIVIAATLQAGTVPPMMNYQGRLTNHVNLPLDTVINMTFRIYADEESTTPLWMEQQSNVSVRYGIFTVLLGSTNPLLDTVFRSEVRWIGLQMGDDVEMAPRRQFATVAYAFRAAYADSANFIPQADGIWSLNGQHAYRNTGNVGIGTNIPGDKLEVITPDANQGLSWRVDPGASVDASATVRLSSNNGRGRLTLGGSTEEASLVHTTGGWRWDKQLNVMGSLGIGTATPSFALDVAGDARTSATLYATHLNMSGESYFNENGLNLGGGAWIKYNFESAETYVNSPINKGVVIRCGDPVRKLVLSHDGSTARVFGYNSLALDAQNDVVISDEIRPANNAFRLGGAGTRWATVYTQLLDATGNVEAGGSIIAAGSITGNSVVNGVNAITGNCTGNYSGVAGVNTGSGNGVYGSATIGYAGYFSGRVHVAGALSKASGSFKIDHPLDPNNKWLSHSFVESPDMKNIYDGIAEFDSNGRAVVNLPDYFETLNRDFRYQLTCIGGYAQVFIEKQILHNSFVIGGGQPGLKVSWQVTGIRQDPWAEQHRIKVEEEKVDDERGKVQYSRTNNIDSNVRSEL